MSVSQESSTDPGRLAQMLSLEDSVQPTWRPHELGAILRHQLSSVVQFELGGLDRQIAAGLRTLAAAEGLLVRSFADLFRHPQPPLALLELTKRFAKACRNHPDSPLPGEVAEVLYLLSIVVALVRCDRRITALDDASLRRSLSWAAAQDWVELDMRHSFRKACKRLVARSHHRHERSEACSTA